MYQLRDSKINYGTFILEFSRQEHWSGLPFPSPGDLPDPEIELRSPMLQADALTSEPPGKPYIYMISYNFTAVFLFMSII